MSKYVLIPDSFKGTMSSSEICAIMAAAIRRHEPKAEIAAIPVADGGEGSVDCFLEAVGGERISGIFSGPFSGEKLEAVYGLIDGGKTAVVEMAACAGLPLVEGRADPRLTTTFGVGQQLLDAAERGASKIIVGLGGSCTNDGGCGMAAALGVHFLNRQGQDFIPIGGTLIDIDRIDASKVNPALAETEIVAMCDIDNPMYGSTGAAHIFGPQKGANPAMIEELDAGLRHLAQIIRRDLNVSVDELPGAGAAGAMGAGMVAFLGARLQMGINTVLDIVHFDQLAKDADLIFTGEGKIDTQSLRGKVVIGVSRRAKPFAVPVIAVVGDIGDGVEAAYDEGVSAIISINRVAVDFPKAKLRAKSDMALTMDNFMRMYQALHRV